MIFTPLAPLYNSFMRVLLACDKFKGTLTAYEACKSIQQGFAQVFPEAEFSLFPMADGGEGMMDIIESHLGGDWKMCPTTDALGHPIEARWLLITSLDNKIAIVETSESNGLFRIPMDQRNPMQSSTFGVGTLLKAALRENVSEIIAGIGGSATNDAGLGMAEALGYIFENSQGTPVKVIPENFLHITQIKSPSSLFPLIRVACDVRNPLLGKNGATYVYGPQKGLCPPQIEPLEKAMSHIADLIFKKLDRDERSTPGAGAAGGLGFGLMSFCDAQLESGFDLIAELTGLENQIALSDIIITGEGSLDAQTLQGKTAAGVARLAKKHQKPIYAIAGRASDEEKLNDLFDHIITTTPPTMSWEETTKNAPSLTKQAGENLAKFLNHNK